MVYLFRITESNHLLWFIQIGISDHLSDFNSDVRIKWSNLMQ